MVIFTAKDCNLQIKFLPAKGHSMNERTHAQEIRATLLHLSFNMWSDQEAPENWSIYFGGKPFMRFDDRVWEEVLQKMVQAGQNMVVIDLGDGVVYHSHPEIAVKNAWNVSRLQHELEKIRKLGLEPIPKLNFSTAHDFWLGPYAKMVSSEPYYAVCRDILAEVIEIFEKPRFFHLGMDEETFAHQKLYKYSVIRQYDLWWADLYFLFEQVEKHGVRPWIWSDYYWHHPEIFLEKMPKSVMQSNWFYGNQFDPQNMEVRAYLDLDQHGFEQIPAGSNWSHPENFGQTVEFCRANLTPSRVKGFLQTTWFPTIAACQDRLFEAIDLAGKAK
jgi:hypothetical protein